MNNQAENLELNKVFTSLFIDQVNNQDVNAVLISQEHIIRRLDLTNKNMKESINESNERYNAAFKDFNSHIQTLSSIKKDLDHVFKKIRVVKTKLEKKYPEEYENSRKLFSKKKRNEDDEDDNDDEYDDESFEESKEGPRSEMTASNEATGVNNPQQQQQKNAFFDINIIKNAKNEISKISSSGKDLVDGIFK